eukprot:COSAG04_NODE_4087_length_2315_cov_8.737816_1_plen_425_part_10
MLGSRSPSMAFVDELSGRLNTGVALTKRGSLGKGSLHESRGRFPLSPPGGRRRLMTDSSDSDSDAAAAAAAARSRRRRTNRRSEVGRTSRQEKIPQPEPEPQPEPKHPPRSDVYADLDSSTPEDLLREELLIEAELERRRSLELRSSSPRGSLESAVQRSEASRQLEEQAWREGGYDATFNSAYEDRARRRLRPASPGVAPASPPREPAGREDALATFAAAKTWAEEGDWPRAARALGLAIELGHPDPALCHHARGIAEERGGFLCAALADFERATELDSENVLALHSAAVKQRQLGQLADAVRGFRACAHQQPGNDSYAHDLREAERVLRRVRVGKAQLMWCVETATLRRGSALESEVVGELRPGEAVVVVSTHDLEYRVAGRKRSRKRVRTEPWRGAGRQMPSGEAWASVTATDGVQLLVDEA